MEVDIASERSSKVIVDPEVVANDGQTNDEGLVYIQLPTPSDKTQFPDQQLCDDADQKLPSNENARIPERALM